MKHRYGQDNPDILKIPEKELEDNHDNNQLVDLNAETDKASVSTSSNKRQHTCLDAQVKTRWKGWVAKGEDWWSSIDHWFESKVNDWGSDFTTGSWKRCTSLSNNVQD